MTVSVYALLGLEGFVRYIGVTRMTLRARLKAHRSDRKKCPRTDWIKKLRKQGFSPSIVEIDRVSETDWCEAERFWISYMRFLGATLVNQNDGGIGPGLHSSLVRARISAKVKAAKNSPERVALRQTEEYRQQMREYGRKNKGCDRSGLVWRSPEFREKCRAAMQKYITPDVLRKRAEEMKQRWADPVQRIRFLAGAHATKKPRKDKPDASALI